MLCPPKPFELPVGVHLSVQLGPGSVGHGLFAISFLYPTKALVLVSLPWVAEDLIPLVPIIRIIVVHAFLVSDTAFVVGDTVGISFGLGLLHFNHCSRATIDAFSISAPNVHDPCFSTQK